MKAHEFCYWLQGLFELAKPTELNSEQTELVRRHLSLAFAHDIDLRYPKEEREKLQAIHDGKPLTNGYIQPPGPSSFGDPHKQLRC